MGKIDERLAELGYTLRIDTTPRKIEMFKTVGDIVYLSGHGPHDLDGNLVAVGRVGSDVTVELGYEASKRVALNALGTLKNAIGDLDRVEEIIKVLGFINSAPDFHRQPEVLNGFTDVLIEVFGDKGRHARSAVGTSNLPNNQSVEVEMIVRIS